MKIGIFGGRFDPIHIAHLRAAIEFYEQIHLDRLIVLPSGIAPHKNVLAPAKDRLEMARLAFAPLQFAQVDDYEIKTEKPAYTVETLKHYKKLYKNSSLFYLVGLDEFLNIESWRNWKECLELANFVVVPRGKNSKHIEMNKNCKTIEMRTLDICSSEIRMRIENGKRVNYLIPEAVRKYIEQKGLYK